MGRDTIQLEDAVSTISEEYLLEFTSEYGIPESLHPELPGPEEHIVEFPEGKVGVYTKFFEFANYRVPISQFLFDILGYYQLHLSRLSVIGAAKVDERIFPTVVEWRTSAPKDKMPSADSYSVVDVTILDTHHMDLFNLISALNPAKVKTGTRPHAAHEVPLLTVTASRVIEMEDTVVALGSSGTPSDGLSHEIPPVETATTTEVVQELWLEKEVAAMGPPVNKRRRKRGNDEAEANAPPKVLRKDHATFRLAQKTPADAKSVSDPEPLSYAKPQPHLKQDVALSSRKTAPEIPTKNVATAEVQDLLSTESLGLYNINLAWQVAMGSQLRLRFEQEVRLLKKATAMIARRDQRIQAREGEIKRLDQEIKSLRTVEAKV
ncbi:hypothetical protein Tco_0920528, partial [Tanacetum coccineum]